VQLSGWNDVDVSAEVRPGSAWWRCDTACLNS
jgi:hypothetical protein